MNDKDAVAYLGENQILSFVIGPFTPCTDKLGFIVNYDKLKDHHHVIVPEFPCDSFVESGRLQLTFKNTQKGSHFYIIVYEEIINWDYDPNGCEISLPSVFGLSVSNDRVCFVEHCDFYYGSDMSTSNAIRLLEEAIEFIKDGR